MTTLDSTLLTPDKDWWRGAVIYQIYPRSYQDTNGDGIGDLNGITERLAHVASLGVDAIWISPFFTSPMKDFGYDVSDYRGVDPMFGTLADFDGLLAEAHRLGLKVNAGHGLNYDNLSGFLKAVPHLDTLNIGHSIVARAVMVGLVRAVREMKELLPR